MSQTVQPDEQIQPDNPAILPAYLKEEEKYADFEMTPEELDFIKSFVVSSSLQGVTTNGITVKIRREHHTVIQEILKHLLVGSSVTAYIDNVLAEHIKKYYPLIMDIIRKCPSKLQ